MKYDNYLIKLSRKINRRLEDIDADHNFEFGNEFEIALCSILRNFLPNKYGIGRGFVVAEDGTKAGDDIIIYDQSVNHEELAFGLGFIHLLSALNWIKLGLMPYNSLLYDAMIKINTDGNNV